MFKYALLVCADYLLLFTIQFKSQFKKWKQAKWAIKKKLKRVNVMLKRSINTVLFFFCLCSIKQTSDDQWMHFGIYHKINVDNCFELLEYWLLFYFTLHAIYFFFLNLLFLVLRKLYLTEVRLFINDCNVLHFDYHLNYMVLFKFL